ncbi:MAG: DUF1003 domain-containing protein [Methylomicrobium sp.]
MNARRISWLIAAVLMIGIGIGNIVWIPLRTLITLPAIIELGVAFLVIIIGPIIFNLSIRKRRQEESVDESPASASVESNAGMILCPVCGGENSEDAVFCGNPACHKALGEFRYVLEELRAEKTRFELLADQVAIFVSRPHFLTLHMAWFTVWIVLNSGMIASFQFFDEYPYDLLGIILSIEAILITGFLLISQNHQAAYSEKRAELDYEINIRSYRKLIELERRLDKMSMTLPEEERRDETS